MTHPLFGYLIAIFLDKLIQSFNSKKEITIFEFGAGNGTLAYDITNGLKKIGQKNYKYVAIDLSESKTIFPVIKKIDDLSKSNGIIITNELFDAIPHHLFSMQNGEIFEKYVEIKNGKFIETLDSPSDQCIKKRIEKVSTNLVDIEGEVLCKEYNIANTFNSLLKKGYILTIDYGMREKDLFYNGKTKAFMNVINNHNFYDDYFYQPGLSDITFQVDMEDLSQEFKNMKFNNEFISSQRQFLYQLGLGESLVSLSSLNIKSEDVIKNRYAINQLIKPNGMGNYFVRLDSNFSNSISFDEIEINRNFIEKFPLLEQFPQRFELPGMYKQNIIINKDLN